MIETVSPMDLDELRAHADAASKSALEVAERLCDRVVAHGTDPFAVALACELGDLLRLAKRLRRAHLIEAGG